MKFLLDTHTLLWHFEGGEKLSARVKEDILFNSEHQLYVSMASLWEVAIKMSIGKLTFTGGFDATLYRSSSRVS